MDNEMEIGSGDTTEKKKVNDEIEKIALAIIKVEGEIEKVEKQIQDVENKLENAEQQQTEQDIQYWRRREERLSREKEQLRRKEEQLRQKEERLYEHSAKFGRPPLHPQRSETDFQFKEIKQELQQIRILASGTDRATPQKTAASVGNEELMRLKSLNLFFRHEGSGSSVLSDKEQRKLEDCTTEHQVIAFLTPFLKRVFTGHPGGMVVVNSEEYKWLETSDDSRYNQKPDLIICHPAYCSSRNPFDTTDEKLLQFRLDGNHRFGILKKWSLRNSIGLTGEGKMSIDNKAFGEVINYGAHICHNQRDGPIQTRLILFDKKEFWLVDSTRGTVSMVTSCGWTTAGSKALLRNFPLVDAWTTVLQEALAHFSVTIDDEEDSFLGAGAFGRVFRVRREQGAVFALKIVKDEGDNQVDLIQERFNMQKAKKLCPELVMGIEDFEWFDGKGGALLLSQVGLHYSEIKNSKWVRIRDSLEELHRNNIIHGDARVENVVAVNGGKPCWIDFRTALWTDNAAAKKRDQETLVESIRAAKDRGW